MCEGRWGWEGFTQILGIERGEGVKGGKGRGL